MTPSTAQQRGYRGCELERKKLAARARWMHVVPMLQAARGEILPTGLVDGREDIVDDHIGLASKNVEGNVIVLSHARRGDVVAV